MTDVTTNDPPFTKAELEEYQRQCEAGVRRTVGECEERWHAEGRPFCWVDREPGWMNIDTHLDNYLPEPLQPCRRILRLCLAGGGQLRITDKAVMRKGDNELAPVEVDHATAKFVSRARISIGAVQAAQYRPGLRSPVSRPAQRRRRQRCRRPPPRTAGAGVARGPLMAWKTGSTDTAANRLRTLQRPPDADPAPV